MTRSRIIGTFLRDHAEAGASVLDVGCGTGEFILRFGSQADICVGIDLSKFALKTGSKKLKAASFLLADATAIPIREQIFDLVICSEVMEHLERDGEAVGEISRVLKDDGSAVFTAPCNPKYWTVEDAADGHLRRYRTADLVRILRSKGLRIEKLWTWGFPTAYLFRRYVSTRLFSASLHKPMTRGRARAVRLMAELLTYIFRFDDRFARLGLGIGIVTIAGKERTSRKDDRSTQTK